MAVITVSRQLGSHGSAVAEAVAARLGYRLVGRELINQAAVAAGVPAAALAEIDELGLLGIQLRAEEHQVYRETVATLMQKMATAGNVVIVGRAGQVVLKDRPQTLHVQIVAPFAIRAHRVAKDEQIRLEAAIARVRQCDLVRSRYLRRHYNVDWTDPNLYDLVVNTARIPVAVAVEIICHATQLLRERASAKEEGSK